MAGVAEIGTVPRKSTSTGERLNIGTLQVHFDVVSSSTLEAQKFQLLKASNQLQVTCSVVELSDKNTVVENYPGRISIDNFRVNTEAQHSSALV